MSLADLHRKRARSPEENAAGGSVFQLWAAKLQDEQALEELSSAIETRQDNIAAEIFDRIRQRVSESSWHAFYATMVENREAAEVAVELGLKTGSVYKASYRIRKMVSQEYTDVCHLTNR